MTKRTELEPQARELYVMHGIRLRAIATRLGVSERTLGTWKNEGKWDEAKACLTDAEGGFHAELFRLGQVVARKIREDLEKPGGQLDDRVYHLAKILDAAERSRKYEEKAPPRSKEGAPTPEKRIAKASGQIREILGLR